ncbi:MAG TPA: NADH-quinone oxidoreductase subunit L [Planctomycetota bacterium]|jgi:NADH-quinone oxidoreductase subunit L|nr:NADH-quinone oxidoreductase subunit L [Planctomycetota bacterium]
MDFLHFDPETDFKLLLAVPLIPLIGYVVQVFFGRFLPRKGDWLVTGGLGATMVIAVFMLAKVLYTTSSGHGGEGFFHHSSEAGMSWAWLYQTGKAASSDLNLEVGILYDGLGAAMLAVVAVVSFFVHLYSIGYMKGDRRYHLFFANISLFSVAMLGLVLADSLLVLFVFWEIMGLMSYLLIGHFAHDPSTPFFQRWATWASKKAFLTTRVGDCCLLIGIMMFWQHYHTFEFVDLWRLTNEDVARHGGEWPAWMTIAGLFIFGGTVGKSAQFPLHIWLPDAMAGPTPVSAMIHAATMVAAGVFLLGRTFPILSPDVLAVVTATGAFTALFAATIGVTAFDLKAVLAWSTISQLGFMVAAIGTGGIGLVAGLFHMVTHAFFKSCLFLSAGSVIHGCHHEQDMRKMGGLRKCMPLTFAAMGISTLAIAGIPLFSGFYSKDKIIQAAFAKTSLEFSGAQVFAAFALPIAAALTAFYMFRMMFMTFGGTYRGVIAEGHGHDEHDDHELVHAADGGIAPGHPGPMPVESPWPMTVSLLCLATLGFLGGKFWLADLDVLAHHDPWFVRLVSPETLYPGVELMNGYGPAITHGMIEHAEHAAHNLALIVSLLVAGLGIFGAWFFYGARKASPERVAKALGEVYRAVARKYYVDELVNGTVIRLTHLCATVMRWFDEHIIDGIVLGVGRLNRALGFLQAWFDRTVVDGLVNGAGALTQLFGSFARLLQTGRIQQYVTFAVGGGLIAAAWLILA